MIAYTSEDIKPPKFSRRATTSWIKAVANEYGRKVGEISYIFCSDTKILELNQKFLNHNYYTDIITFDYSDNDTISGDIFISLETVMSNAKEYSVGIDEELHRVIIHGILHLCGLEDKTTEQQKIMRQSEDIAMKMIKK